MSNLIQVQLFVKNGRVTTLDGTVMELEVPRFIPGYWYWITSVNGRLTAQLVHRGINHVLCSMDITENGVYLLSPYAGQRLETRS